MILQPASHIDSYGIPHGIAGMDYDFRQGHGEGAYREALDRALASLQIQPRCLFHANQVHGKRVGLVDQIQVDTNFAGYPILDATDALVTATPGTALLVRMADCTPILIYDPVHRVLGLAHSGWRSTVQRISQEVIQAMAHHYGSRAQDLLVYLGPSIGQADYQVGPEVYAAFEGIGDRQVYFAPDGDRYRLSMIQANRQVLLQAGVPKDQIQVSQASTFTSPDLHSARREGPDYGLNALIAYLPDR